MNDPITQADIEAARVRVREFLASDHGKHVPGSPGHDGATDEIPADDLKPDLPPPHGWKQDANGNWGPPGWVKRGDSWGEE